MKHTYGDATITQNLLQHRPVASLHQLNANMHTLKLPDTMNFTHTDAHKQF